MILNVLAFLTTTSNAKKNLPSGTNNKRRKTND